MTPLPNDLLALLVCPKTKQPLIRLPADQLAALNQRIAAGEVCDLEGTPLEAPLTEALITRNGNTIYPVVEDMPVLLEGRGIVVESA